MVKKFLFLLTFLFITLSFNLDVNAMPLGYPTVFPRYFDTIGNSQTATRVDWWSTEYYSSPFPLGLTSTTSGYNQIDFNWFNANLCPNSNLHISGSIGGLYTLFYKSPTVAIYNNGQRMTCTFSDPLDSGSRITFNCSGVGGGNLSIYIQESNPDFTDTYTVGITRDIDVRCEASNNDIINNQNANTNSIINNQNQNTNTITQNQDSNTQDIINNQNQNTQDILDDNKKHFETCSPRNYLSYSNLEQGSLNNTGDNSTSIPNVRVRTSSKINLTSGTYVLTSPNMEVVVYRFDETGTVYQSDRNQSWHSSPYTFTLNDNGSVRIAFRFPNSSSISPTIVSNLKPILYNSSSTDEECINKLDEQTDAINNLNDTLNDTNSPNTESEIENLKQDLISDTPITDLITLPITLINSYIQGFNGTCSPFNLGTLFGSSIILPCLNIQSYLGDNLWSIIDGLFSIFMIYNIAMLFITAFEGFTSLRDDYESLYIPRHADVGYQPKHGGDS